MHHGLSQFEETLVQQAEAKRQSRNQQNQRAGQGTDWIFLQCGRNGRSRIGLLSHTRCCSKTSIQSMLPSSLKTEGCLIQTARLSICTLQPFPPQPICAFLSRLLVPLEKTQCHTFVTVSLPIFLNQQGLDKFPSFLGLSGSDLGRGWGEK